MHLAFSVWFVIFHIHGMLYLVFQIGFIIILSDFNAMHATSSFSSCMVS